MKVSEDILFVLLGLPTWILVDGTWGALSQIALSAPEGFTISSYLMLALTSGNIFPLVMGNILKGSSQQTIVHIISYILSIGLISGILLGLCWDKTVRVNDQLVSVPLYVIFFIIGSCAASSNITHFMFVSSYPARATSMMSTGFGLGSMTAGIIALLQGLLLKHYGVTLMTYFIILSLVYLPAMFSLYWLCYKHHSNADGSTGILRSPALARTQYTEIENPKEKLIVNVHSDAPGEVELHHSIKSETESEFLRDHRLVLLLQFSCSSLGYGMIPSIISFACSKFEHKDTVLLFATSIASACNPLFRMSTEYYELKSQMQLFIASIGVISVGLTILTCAFLPSDSSIYKGNGGVLPVILYISFNGLFGYTNTCIFRYLKSNVSPACVQHAYRWGGLSMQAGALVGSVLTFSLIISKVFH